MSKRVYEVSWTERFSTKVPAQVAHREFQRIAKAKGSVTPQALLDAARPEEAPLHELFEWNDWVAAEQWRLTQAREVISSLRIVVREGEPPVPAMAYLQVHSGGDRRHRAFLPMTSVIDNDLRRRQFLLGELRNLEGVLLRSAAFPEMEPLREALVEVKAALIGETAQAMAAD